MGSDGFKYPVIRKLEREGYRVHPIWNDNHRCPFDLLSVNPGGTVAGVRVQAHGHPTEKGKKELLWYNIPIYWASEAYGVDKVHEIKIERLTEGKE